MFRVYIFIFALGSLYAQHLMKTPNNYGPYNMEIQNYSDCKGPKLKNLTVMSTTMDKTLFGVVNLTFLADAKLDGVRVSVSSIKGNKKNFLWNYKVNDPCKHYSIAITIKQNLNSDNCFVKKGFYSNRVNFKDTMLSFLGTSFFYGNYFFKAELTSKKGNIGCFIGNLVFTKKM